MGDYVLKRQNKFTQYIVMQPILDLCNNMVQSLGAWVARIWWYQELLDLAGTMAATAAEEDREYGSEGGEEERWLATGSNRRHGI